MQNGISVSQQMHAQFPTSGNWAFLYVMNDLLQERCNRLSNLERNRLCVEFLYEKGLG